MSFAAAARWFALILGCATIVACSDGSSNTTTAPTVTPAASTTLTGTAATGAPLANATVSVLCGGGTLGGTATTASTGNYTSTVASTCAAPYMLKVTGTGPDGNTLTMYAFADKAGNINITPFTDIAAGVATGGDPAAEYDAILKATKKVSEVWNSTTSGSATQAVKTKLTELGLTSSGIEDLFHGVFKAQTGDKTDDLLEQLKTKRGGVSLQSLVEQIVKKGGQPGDAPWKVMFAGNATSFAIKGTSCSYTPSGSSAVALSGTVTVTLSRTTTSLMVSVNTGSSSVNLSSLTVGSGFADSSFSFKLLNTATSVVMSVYDNTTSFSYMGDPNERIKGISTPARSAFTEPRFVYDTFGTGSLECNTVVAPLTKSGLNGFDLAARLASIAAGTTSVIASPSSCGGSPTYTFSLSSVGDLKISGTSLTGAWLDTSGSYFYDLTRFTATGVDYGQVEIRSLSGSNARSVTVSRYFGSSPRVMTGCGDG